MPSLTMPSEASTAAESKTDVLIVGAGPAGFMLATWMAHCGVNARIIDKRGTKVFNGQADGLQSRTQEIFESFGFADRVAKEAYKMEELSMWVWIHWLNSYLWPFFLLLGLARFGRGWCHRQEDNCCVARETKWKYVG